MTVNYSWHHTDDSDSWAGSTVAAVVTAKLISSSGTW